MGAFIGFVSLSQAPVLPSLEERAIGALGLGRKRFAAIQRSASALIVQETANTSSTRTSSADGGILLVASARLDNREELGAALGMGGARLAQTSDAALVGESFARGGDAGLARILGGFAFAQWDGHRLVLARDCLGDAPLFFYAQKDFVVFASTLKSLLALREVPREIDEVMLGHFLALNMRDPRRTLYRGIERVPSRTRMTIDAGGVRHAQYWAPNPGALPVYRHEAAYAEQARALFDQSVAAALRGTDGAALFLSGGFDSSAIAATAAKLGLAGKLTCYTAVPPEGAAPPLSDKRYGDERSKVEALRRMHPALDIRYVVPPEVHAVDEDPTRHFLRCGLPARNVTNLGWFSGLEDAIDPAADALLLGSMGNFGLTWDGTFALAELLRAGQFAQFAAELGATARESGKGIARTLWRDVALRMAPDGLYRLYNTLRSNRMAGAGRYTLLNPDFVAAHDLGSAWQAQNFDPAFTLRGRAAAVRAHHMFDHNQHARDVRAMHRHAYGRPIRDPHGDRRLLEFCLSVPEPMYRRGGVPRAFARTMLADRLPPEILGERRRGLQAPLWFRSLDARREDFAREIERLDASPAAQRMLNLPRLKRLLREWPKDAEDAHARRREYRLALTRGIHAGRFIRWVEGGNA